jgi:hypothetical protein
MPITITLPTGEAEKLKAHEGGHEKIVEHFYSVGAQAAQRAGQITADKEYYTFYGKDFESAKSNALSWAGHLVESEYWKFTRYPCEQANEYYDELTDHGRNNVDSDQAAQEAIRRYELQVPN